MREKERKKLDDKKKKLEEEKAALQEVTKKLSIENEKEQRK